jgi:hypothetical protein
MRYLVLIHGSEREWETLPATERSAVYEEFRAFAERMREAGKLLGGDELAPTDRATTVRVRDGETLVSDGPYAETREALGGYFLLDCASLDEAVELARGLPKPRGAGGIEVRPAYEDDGGEEL